LVVLVAMVVLVAVIKIAARVRGNSN